MISMSVRLGLFFFFSLPMSLSKLILTVHIVAAKLSRKERGLRWWGRGSQRRENPFVVRSVLNRVNSCGWPGPTQKGKRMAASLTK